MKTIGAVTVVIISGILSTLWYGYVLSVLWGWFIVPTFGITRLSIPAAVGIAAIVGYVAKGDSSEKDENKSAKDAILTALIHAFGRPAVTLGFCWIVKHWM